MGVMANEGPIQHVRDYRQHREEQQLKVEADRRLINAQVGAQRLEQSVSAIGRAILPTDEALRNMKDFWKKRILPNHPELTPQIAKSPEMQGLEQQQQVAGVTHNIEQFLLGASDLISFPLNIGAAAGEVLLNDVKGLLDMPSHRPKASWKDADYHRFSRGAEELLKRIKGAPLVDPKNLNKRQRALGNAARIAGFFPHVFVRGAKAMFTPAENWRKSWGQMPMMKKVEWLGKKPKDPTDLAHWEKAGNNWDAAARKAVEEGRLSRPEAFYLGYNPKPDYPMPKPTKPEVRKLIEETAGKRNLRDIRMAVKDPLTGKAYARPEQGSNHGAFIEEMIAGKYGAEQKGAGKRIKQAGEIDTTTQQLARESGKTPVAGTYYNELTGWSGSDRKFMTRVEMDEQYGILDSEEFDHLLLKSGTLEMLQEAGYVGPISGGSGLPSPPKKPSMKGRKFDEGTRTILRTIAKDIAKVSVRDPDTGKVFSVRGSIHIRLLEKMAAGEFGPEGVASLFRVFYPHSCTEIHYFLAFFLILRFFL